MAFPSITDEILNALRQVESGGGKYLKSPAGALGPYQFMPATAAEMGIDPMDEDQSREGARRLLESHLKRFGGDMKLALMAYHAGAGNVSKWQSGQPSGVGPKTLSYPDKVLALTQQQPVQIASADKSFVPSPREETISAPDTVTTTPQTLFAQAPPPKGGNDTMTGSLYPPQQPTGTLYDGSYNASPDSGGMWNMSPSDRWGALFAGLSAAGNNMAKSGQRGFGALAAGLGGIGAGIQDHAQQQLMQKLLGMKFGEAKDKATARKLMSSVFTDGTEAPKPLDVAQPGQSVAMAMQNRMNAQAATDRGNRASDPRILQALALDPSLAPVVTALRAEDDPSKRFMKLSDETVVDLKAPGGPKVTLTVAQPKTDIGKAIADRDRLPLGDPRRDLIDADINKRLTESGYRFTPNGMSAATGGPADPNTIRQKSYAEAAGAAPVQHALKKAEDFTLGDKRFSGGPLNLMPWSMPPGTPMIGQPRPPQPAPMPQVNPQAMGGQPGAPAPMPPIDPSKIGAVPGQPAPMPQIEPPGQQPLVDPTKPRVIAENPTDKSFERVNTLRDEFDKHTGRYGTVRNAYQKVQEASKLKTGPGDMALLYGYIKMLDADSAVREGEYATADNAQSVPEHIRAMYNRAVNGELMQDDVRQRFVQAAGSQYDVERRSYDALVDRYTGLAKDLGLKPEHVVRKQDKIGSSSIPNIPTAGYAEGAVLNDPTGKPVATLRGGQWVPIK